MGIEDSRNKTGELIEYLRSLGFSGERLEKDIIRNAAIGLPKFRVRHRTTFGGDTVLYDFLFSTDGTDGYRPGSLRATCRSRMDIGHLTYRGIDTGALEERMKDIDWFSYFGSPSALEDGEAARAIVEQMNMLYDSNDIAAIEVHQQLAFIYWPLEVHGTLKHPQVRHGETEYIPTTEFQESELRSGVNASLAYHIASGNLGSLYHGLLEPVGLEDFAGLPLDHVLRRELSENPDTFEIKCSRNSPDGLIKFSIPIQRIRGGYDADTIHATFIKHPEIGHGVYNGIDSLLLEEIMREIDWRDERSLFRYEEGDAEPDFNPKVVEIREQLYHLGRDMAGCAVADQLQLKYWIGVPFFEGEIDQTAWDELEERPRISLELPIANNAPRIFNVMRGRPVMDRNMEEFVQGSGLWLKLDATGAHHGDTQVLREIRGFTIDKLESLLKMLPIADRAFYGIRDALMDGEIVDFPVEGGKTVLLGADPESKTLNLYTPDMERIPFNFGFDPNWKPAAAQKPTMAKQLGRRTGGRSNGI
ncbi:hypothetical protein JHJ32_07690 [Parapedobacter sp. ISTM3]|uniref:hypothetical protein n=1 Tax=Parapedobacter sp. ISTM3 TaxID=2800130 RepID=UPI001904D511|nr:hypothetical protein [Parapedobacter sp. ISTM3]MBK1439860.1 hypothetical protein [Parapedobacter sp. ISTM3]